MRTRLYLDLDGVMADFDAHFPAVFGLDHRSMADEGGSYRTREGEFWPAVREGRAAFGKLRPSMFMPRWASRVTLTVTDVRVERLQDISEEDARDEGVERDSDGWRDYQMPATQCCATPKTAYLTLWESINGAGSWAANPWVVAYSFTVERRNIDAEG